MDVIKRFVNISLSMLVKIVVVIVIIIFGSS